MKSAMTLEDLERSFEEKMTTPAKKPLMPTTQHGQGQGLDIREAAPPGRSEETSGGLLLRQAAPPGFKGL